MLRQPRGERDFEVVDAAIVGTFGSPQAWGNEIRPGRRVDFRSRARSTGRCRSCCRRGRCRAWRRSRRRARAARSREEVYLGSVITLPLGDGRAASTPRSP